MLKAEPFYVSAEFDPDGTRATPWKRHTPPWNDGVMDPAALGFDAASVLTAVTNFTTETLITSILGTVRGERRELRFRQIGPADPWIDTDRASYMCALVQRQAQAKPHTERARTVGVMQGIIAAAQDLYAQYQEQGRQDARDALKAQAYWGRKLAAGAPTS